MSSERKIVGIDLGTTFSAIAHVDQFAKPEIIPNGESERITPSVILFEDSGVIVGTVARQNAIAEPHNVVEFVKRQIGKSIEDFYFEFKGTRYSAPMLSALILKKLVNDAAVRLKQPITDAVITVPAYFNDLQRNATVDAGKIAGLEVPRIINEPTAAALAYGFDKVGENQTVFVFDLGGGTFDVTIMRIQGHEFRTIATNGDHMLGGKDFDDVLLLYVADMFREKFGVDPLDDPYSYQDLQNRIVQAKIALSQRPRTSVTASHAGHQLTVELTQQLFEELSSSLVDRCQTLMTIVLDEANHKWKDIDCILLTGGATRMPMVQRMIQETTGKAGRMDISPDECVAMGAAIEGAMISIEQGEASATIVAKLGDLVTTDINSHSLGIIAYDDTGTPQVVKMIPKGTALPFEHSESFETLRDNQDNVRAEVVEGESENPLECTPIGECILFDLPPRPKGMPLTVTYRYNKNQMLEVEIIDVETGKQGRSSIIRRGGLSDEEVNQGRLHLDSLRVE